MSVPVVLILSAITMIAIERLVPGHRLPKVRHWALRVLLVDAVQIGVVLGFGYWLEPHILALRFWSAEGLGLVGGSVVGYLAITFVYYWWHRWRHEVPFLWRTLHQLHHSPKRLEIVTSFYKHPAEILANATLSSALLYLGVGLTPGQVAGTVLLSTLAELFYHWNIRTPRWLGWFIQRPEMHRVHHARGRHAFNYGDLPIWDMLFGTYRNPATYAGDCGFDDEELQVGEMLAFREVTVPPDALPHRNTFQRFCERFSPRRRAMALLALGMLAMTGDTLGQGKLTGLGLITGAAPYPKVFTTRDGLEGFSSTFEMAWEDQEACYETTLTPELYRALEGPYNRRNIYGAAMAGGPFLSSDPLTEPMLRAVSDRAFCERELLDDLGLGHDVRHVWLELTPRDDAAPTTLPLSWEIAC